MTAWLGVIYCAESLIIRCALILGTSYDAELLSRRPGTENVASINLDPALDRLARTRLAALGHQTSACAEPRVASEGVEGLVDEKLHMVDRSAAAGF